ncbi:MAG: DKNYY domain-containing protein [Sebaldella sp.]|nr:DKNYY domain-containing protein [Sebaldella sp.]
MPKYVNVEKQKVIYYKSKDTGEIVKIKDYKTFVIIDQNFAKDKKKVYYQGKVVKNLDSKTFQETVIETIEPAPNLNGTYSQSSRIWLFKDKNGTYSLEDIQNGKLELE